jgi:WhiB family redox-sensing transcriptional regulator
VPEDWEEFASCKGSDTEIFFNNSRKAKEICAECLVSAECLEFAITHRKNYGVWGGATVHEREVIRAKRRSRGR